MAISISDDVKARLERYIKKNNGWGKLTPDAKAVFQGFLNSYLNKYLRLILEDAISEGDLTEDVVESPEALKFLVDDGERGFAHRTRQQLSRLLADALDPATPGYSSEDLECYRNFCQEWIGYVESDRPWRKALTRAQRREAKHADDDRFLILEG